ncbi:MAG: crossover junction endodeoxyribonuclease RuvC [Candidatus Levybacteria bacterium]|nr:crossover junction endodeoxyribonuclease RuvC [Candidatus Levybacteria bacterium]
MKTLGIDPGYARVGWAVVESQNAKCKMQNCGCIETSKNTASQKRLVDVYEQVCVLIKKYKPDNVAVEELFFTTNAKTAFKVGEARGVIILAAALQKISVASYTPLQVKIAVTGYGKADKAQVGRMIRTILQLKDIPKLDDTADAIAVALTHAFTKKFK